MRVLITGASGFVGSALARRLIAAGLDVRGTHRRALPPSIGAVEWRSLPQLDSTQALRDAVTGCETVVHLAALAHQHGRASVGRLQEFLRINVEGTRALAHVSREAGVRRFIFASSVAAVCSQSDAWVDEATACAPQSDYGRSKLEGEGALQAELRDSATDWCIVRPPLAYGPDNPGNMARLMRLIETGVPLPFGAIRNCRSFMFVDNLADALFTVVQRPDPLRSTFLLGDGSDFGTPELVVALAKASGRTARLFGLPVNALKWLGRVGDGVDRLLGVASGVDSYSVDRLVSSLPVRSSKFRAYFAWRPPTDVAQALKLTCTAANERRTRS
jgi:nucleoside-diphosphate-sugar epimerase